NYLRRSEALLAGARTSDVGRYSHPQWWIDKVRLQYPEHYASILASGNARPPLTLRVNARRTSVADYVARLAVSEIAAKVSGEVARLVGRRRIRRNTGRCAVLGVGRSAPASGHQVVAAPRGHRALRRTPARYPGRALAGARVWW